MAKHHYYFKELSLYPMEIKLHVWVLSNVEVMAELFHRHYGECPSYYKDNISPNQCAIISSTTNSLTKGETVIEVNISDLELKVLVHELNHVYYQLCEICSIDLDKASQEWHSYTLEYLYDQLDKLTKFEKKTIVL